MHHLEPVYVALWRSGELERRAAAARERLSACDLCPRGCGVDRTVGETGACRTADLAVVASAGPHFGEEDCLVGRGGSGTVFFAGCNLACVFCQNHDISQSDPLEAGRREVRGPIDHDGALPCDAERLAEVMVRLQTAGCENINLVSPSHVVPQILAALVVAAGEGLRLPLVYNSGGYDALPTLALLDGIMDIYMPDMKYADERLGRRLSGVADYVMRSRAALREMYRQVGDLRLDRRGVAHKGLLVRHLVLPGRTEDVGGIASFLAAELSPQSYLNLMDQYHPAYKVLRRPGAYPEIERRLTRDEYRAAVDAALAAGLERLDGLAL